MLQRGGERRKERKKRIDPSWGKGKPGADHLKNFLEERMLDRHSENVPGGELPPNREKTRPNCRCGGKNAHKKRKKNTGKRAGN